MQNDAQIMHVFAKVIEQQRKRRSAAIEFLFGVSLAALGLSMVTWLLLPAGALMGWSAKTLVEAQRIDTVFHG